MADRAAAHATGDVRRRLRYWFDNTMARGTPALIGWLALVCLLIVIPVSAALVWADKETPTTLRNQLVAIWKNIGETFSLGGAIGTPAYVLLSVLLAVVALLFASTLVGLITTGVQNKIMDLRQGRSMVLEDRHLVVLGWSDQVYPIVSQLAEAESNQRKAVVAILAAQDKVEMEENIRAKVPDLKGTRVICRTGDTADPAVVRLVNPHTARSVIVVARDEAATTADAQVIKTLLALNSGPGLRPDGHVVAVVRDSRNLLAAKLAAGERGRVLSIDDVTARLIVQTARQPGLSLVYTDLLNFEGDEFYTVAEPRLVGRPFGEALLAYDSSSVVGLVRADDGIELNPPADSVIREDDLIIVITEDDDTAVLAERPADVDEGAIVEVPDAPAAPERVLLLGWNRRTGTVIEQLAGYVADGSVIDVVARGASAAAEAEQLPPYSNLTVNFRSGETSQPEVLESLDIGSYSSVILLGYENEDEAEETRPEPDVETLVTLLHLRAMEAELGRELRVVTEMSDDSNRALAPISEGADFIVSGKVISLLMTQISENHRLADLFRELGNPDGYEIYLKPATHYVAPRREVTYATVVESARRQRQCAIGYRLHEESATGPAFGIHLNPDKRSTVRFGDGDSVIVLAED
ncbi:NAD-binding lipoprotein [Streptomyces sp. A7024]|uniref:NAD-binding lipoprotein n=1 Tax=Streptomyces coryli TaxID=1128680 RepID=A0A6G4U7Q0_9ACTN|nr:NAD-binding lipoprotein [Streptomyces coryli]NGN68259.1 NAD-binding lipoprotein [Streptomyces coryli]